MLLFWLEVKRLLKTRSTQIILALALVLSAVMAYLPISFAQYSYLDEIGQKVTLEGRAAIAAKKADMAPYSGSVTPEKMMSALAVYQEEEARYGSIYSDEFPLNVYNERIRPAYTLIKRLQEVNADGKTGMAPEIADLTAQDAANFYPQCQIHLADLMRQEQKEHLQAQEKAIEMYEKVEQPFVFYYGLNRESMDYLVLYLFLLLLLGTMVAAPVFAAEYQSKADQILRCTRYGRLRLAMVKIGAAACILTALFAVCLTIFTLITNSAFGWESRQTTIQVLFSAVTLPALNMGQLQTITIAAGAITFLATMSCTLFFSSRCQSNVGALALSLGGCLLPLLLYFIVGGHNWADWLRCLLPAAGAGINNSFHYAFIDFTFLHLGSWSVWEPWVMMAAAVVEIPVFLAMSVYTYCRHRL